MSDLFVAFLENTDCYMDLSSSIHHSTSSFVIVFQTSAELYFKTVKIFSFIICINIYNVIKLLDSYGLQFKNTKIDIIFK